MVLDMSQVAHSSEDGRWFQLVTSGSPYSDLTVVAIGYFFVVTNCCNQLDTTGYRPQTYFILFFFKKEKTHEPNPTWRQLGAASTIVHTRTKAANGIHGLHGKDDDHGDNGDTKAWLWFKLLGVSDKAIHFGSLVVWLKTETKCRKPHFLITTF